MADRYGRWTSTHRRGIATVIAIVAIVGATAIASAGLLRLAFQNLDVIAYLGLFIACWIGAGGALVPVPGVRPLSWFMIVQQGAALEPVIVAFVGASAMVLGQSSYFLATAAAKSRLAAGADHHTSTAANGDAVDSDADDQIPAQPLSRRARYLRAAHERVDTQVRRHGMATVFAVSALPSPFTTLSTTAAASSGMAYTRFFVAAFGGFLVFTSVLALVGQGLLAVLRNLLPWT